MVREVRGLGLTWAIEFGEPRGGSRTGASSRHGSPASGEFVIGPLFATTTS